MSGRRKAAGKSLRHVERASRFRKLLASAPTVEAQAALAWDWWRSAAKHCPDRDALFAGMTRQLANEANEMDGSARCQ